MKFILGLLLISGLVLIGAPSMNFHADVMTLTFVLSKDNSTNNFQALVDRLAHLDSSTFPLCMGLIISALSGFGLFLEFRKKGVGGTDPSISSSGLP
jgi:hypothetical protein